MNKSTKTILITYLSFGIYFLLDGLYFSNLRDIINQITKNAGISHFMTYLISGIPIYCGVILNNNNEKFCHNLGLSGSIWKGIFISLLFTLPMFIGYAAVFQINYEINLDDILIKVVSAAFFEELFFRGFLFGQVFKTTKIGFIPAVLIGSLLFGFLHLYQSDDILESLGIFIITFFGGILFAWVFVEWNYNLWMAIFLHFFMNLSALLFSATENALGGIYFNVFRSLSLILVISITIFYKKNKRLNFQINKNTIWVKK